MAIGLASDIPPPPPRHRANAPTRASLDSSPSAPLYRIVAALVGAALVVVSAAWVGGDWIASVARAPAPESVDEVCQRELEERGRHAEARAWIADPRHLVLGLADPSSAVGLVNVLYGGGATQVEVTRLQGSRLQQTSGTIVAAFPPSHRADVLAAANRGLGIGERLIPNAPGAVVEQGERYLRITLQPPIDASDAPNPWATERELRELSRPEHRGL